LLEYDRKKALVIVLDLNTRTCHVITDASVLNGFVVVRFELTSGSRLRMVQRYRELDRVDHAQQMLPKSGWPKVQHGQRSIAGLGVLVVELVSHCTYRT
jgi:hypothetical protein